VLGPVEAHTGDGRVLVLPRRQERCLLAILLLNPGHPVSVDRLCDLLWEDQLPQRPQQAIRTYVSRIRTMLAGMVDGGTPAEQLGLDPRPELQDLHRAILRGEPARHPDAPVTPAQLPADQAGFTGRAIQLRRLDGLLRADAVVVSIVTGTAGVGKTAFAVHWAHRVRNRFPDGQLYLNLRGYAPNGPMQPVDALAQFLAALGVPGERIPGELDQAASLYRSLVADRRLLVVLDDARSPAQVRPL